MIRPRIHRPSRRRSAAILFVLLGLLASRTSAGPPPDLIDHFPPERPDDPPAVSGPLLHATTPAATIPFGRFTSVQVNVDPTGANIVGDAANEPSIAVDPNDPRRMAIGWRQFDSIKSNFREAGFASSLDGGVTWTAGEIDPGVFRSDPVLGSDSEGNFLYGSLSHLSKSPKKKRGEFAVTVFHSTDGGRSWGTPAYAYGGDKEWMVVDRAADDYVYEAWSIAANPTEPNTFSRSIDGGESFQTPSFIPTAPIWGTLDLGPDGTLYVVGIGPTGFSVARSTDARNPSSAPTFTTAPVNLGGYLNLGGPNPDGLLGQPWIAVDRSIGPRSGWIYVLASVWTPSDPLDLKFVRSTDGGATWSAPVRVNDDAVGNRAFQWFGTMSVAPNGRIDVVWNDTRGSTDSTKSALYYAYSNDGGVTWSPNEQASPIWDSTVGWPKQKKIGDYYHMISRDDGADLAWAATFNGEQDVYYLRIPAPVVTLAESRSGPGRLETTAVSARSFGLRSCSPNPFRSSTAIRFDLPQEGGLVRLGVFDAGGRRVATLVDERMSGGPHTARWSGSDDRGRASPAGLYLCRLELAGRTETLKLMLLR